MVGILFSFLVTDCINGESNTIGCIRLHFFPVYQLNQLTFDDLVFLSVTMYCLGLKVKAKG